MANGLQLSFKWDQANGMVNLETHDHHYDYGAEAVNNFEGEVAGWGYRNGTVFIHSVVWDK